MENIVFKLEHINKSYYKNVVLKNLNMAFYKNDIYGFIGDNGADKTTTMRLIMTIVRQNSGEVILFGSKDKKTSEFNHGRVGAIIENPAFYPYLSAYDN